MSSLPLVWWSIWRSLGSLPSSLGVDIPSLNSIIRSVREKFHALRLIQCPLVSSWDWDNSYDSLVFCLHAQI